MCYTFRQIFPFHGELKKDKIATCLLLPPAVFLSPPTFWEARDQPEPGSFFPRMKDPGNEVAQQPEPHKQTEFLNITTLTLTQHDSDYCEGHITEHELQTARKDNGK